MTVAESGAPPRHPHLQLIFGALSASRTHLEQVVAASDDAALARRPTPDEWSGLEILEHLVRTEDGISRMVRKLVRDALAAGLPDDPQHDGAALVASLAPFGIEAAATRVQAPTPLVPAGGASREVLLAGLGEARGRLLEWLRAGDGRALGTLVWPHPLFGPMTVYQWGLFVAQHEERHVRQLERTLAR